MQIRLARLHPLAIAAALALSALSPLTRADEPTPAPDGTAAPTDTQNARARRAMELIASLHPQTGKITLKNGIAELNVPKEFAYLDPSDARKVLVDYWGNPPDTADGLLGMIVPSDMPPGESWGATVNFSDSGYVGDSDADKIDYNDLLNKLKKGLDEANPERVKAGYRALTLVGWAQPPRYDKANKKMYWAKELQVEGVSSRTLNYDIRILGRRGVLVLSAIAGMEQLDEINKAAPQMLSMIDFNQGHRYADFNPKTDKTAAYGLAGLVAGGLILAKIGGFKAILIAILALKKFVFIGVVAVIGFFKKIFGIKKKAPVTAVSVPPAGPAPTIKI